MATSTSTFDDISSLMENQRGDLKEFVALLKKEREEADTAMKERELRLKEKLEFHLQKELKKEIEKVELRLKKELKKERDERKE